MTPMQAWRKRLGLSQRAAAERLGVTLPTYQSWEREIELQSGKPKPPPSSALLAAAALEHGLEPVSASP